MSPFAKRGSYLFTGTEVLWTVSIYGRLPTRRSHSEKFP